MAASPTLPSSSSSRGPGGFLLSPPASSTVSSSPQTLPQPRSSPLRPGGSKEGTFIRFVDQRLLHIQRRFAKRTTQAPPTTASTFYDLGGSKPDVWGDVKGYASMREACKEVDELLSIIWISGTPSLQVPYLLVLAGLVGGFVSGMPASPRALFGTLEKLDVAFASLLQGRDVESGEALPGRERVVSGTEKVRIRSVVERIRVAVVEACKGVEFEYGEGEGEGEDENEDEGEGEASGVDSAMDTDGELVLENGPEPGMVDVDEDDFDMRIARVFHRTVQELGDSLEQPSLGVVTEGRG